VFALEGFTWGTGLSDAWSSFVSFAPKVLAFVAVLVVGRFVLGLVRRALSRALTRFGFDRVVERAGLTRALSGAGSTPSKTVAKLAHYALMLFLLTTAFSVFGPTNPISVLLNRVIAYLPRVAVAIAIVVVAGLVARTVRNLVAELLAGKVPNAPLLARGAGIAVTVIGGFAAIDQLDIAPQVMNGLWYGALATIVGSAVVAIGGGGIAPMRRQWETALGRLEQHSIDLRRTQAAQVPVTPAEYTDR
jgi:hypothetical protein